MGMLGIQIKVVRRRFGGGGHHVPARAPAGDEIQRSKLARQIVGFFVGGGGGGDKADILRQWRQRRKQGNRLEARHFRSTTVGHTGSGDRQAVSQEVGIKQAAFGGLGKLLMEFKAGRAIGGSVRVTPRRDMLAAAGKESP